MSNPRNPDIPYKYLMTHRPSIQTHHPPKTAPEEMKRFAKKSKEMHQLSLSEKIVIVCFLLGHSFYR